MRVKIFGFQKRGKLCGKQKTTNQIWFKTLPDDKILDWSKLKHFADSI